jgi:hypothetical protein
MDWQNIKLSSDNKSFTYQGKEVFGRTFHDALKFHAPGLAAVDDDSGCYHIDTLGNELYKERYTRTFGYYCNRAAVAIAATWFHLTENGKRAYANSFSWVGNYQEHLCPVRDQNDHYFHIDVNGLEVYAEKYVYAGDYKDGISCVKTADGFYQHIDSSGNAINGRHFLDLGVFHKNYATAKDAVGWYHIDKSGNALYDQRYQMIEPFYNGFAIVETTSDTKRIIDENGSVVLEL